MAELKERESGGWEKETAGGVCRLGGIIRRKCEERRLEGKIVAVFTSEIAFLTLSKPSFLSYIPIKSIDLAIPLSSTASLSL